MTSKRSRKIEHGYMFSQQQMRRGRNNFTQIQHIANPQAGVPTEPSSCSPHILMWPGQPQTFWPHYPTPHPTSKQKALAMQFHVTLSVIQPLWDSAYMAFAMGSTPHSTPVSCHNI